MGVKIPVDGLLDQNERDRAIGRVNSLTLFLGAFIVILPRLVRSIWATWKSSNPNTTSIWVYGAYTDNGQFLSSIQPGHGASRSDGGNHGIHHELDPHHYLTRGTYGVDYPARFLIKYSPGTPAGGERVEVDFTWDPAYGSVPATLEAVAKWAAELRSNGEEAARYLGPLYSFFAVPSRRCRLRRGPSNAQLS